MPTFPSPAQADASHRNGSLSRGPVTPEGKARSSRNATSHGLRGGSGVIHLLPGEDRAAFQALHADLFARHAPLDSVERHCVEQLAFVAWRERRLCALEVAVLAGEAGGGTDEPEARPVPSLATLARYRARLERDARHIEVRLEALRRSRPLRHLPDRLARASAVQLRWLADRMEDSAPPATERGTVEPEPTSRGEAAAPTPMPVPAPVGTLGPSPLPDLGATLVPVTTVAPTPARSACESRPLSRRERRRLAALERQARRRAA